MARIEQKGSLQRLLPFLVSPVVAHDAVPMRIARNYQMAQLVNDRVSQYDGEGRVTLDREILNVGIDHAEEDIGPPVGPSSNWCETHCMPRGPTTWSLFCDHNGSVAFRGRRQVWILETVRVDPSKFDSGIVQYSDGLGPGNISDCRVNT